MGKMPHSFGYRARTRDLFSKRKGPGGDQGCIPIAVYFKNIKVGDFVDIKGDGAVHKGMPHKYYTGKTGRVCNVSRRAIGVIITKEVNGRILDKKIHVRVEHVRPSKCRDGFLKRAAAKKAGKFDSSLSLRRQPAGPQVARTIKATKEQTLTLAPVPFKHLYA